jgi:hypothetical protein
MQVLIEEALPDRFIEKQNAGTARQGRRGTK